MLNQANDNGIPHLPGLAAGCVGLAVFLTLHHIWILPIWFILPIGVPIALLGGMAVSWAYLEIAPGLPPRPWTSLALLGVIAIALTPALILGELRAPMFDIGGSGGGVLLMTPGRAAITFVYELLLTAALTGALVGWLVGRSKRAIGATALAAFVFAAGPGHNIPFGGGTPAVGLETVIMLAIVAPAALILVEGHAYVGGRRNHVPVAAQK